MARPVGLSNDVVAAVRTLTGAPVVADSVTLTDANFPLTISDTLGGPIPCAGFSTIWVNAEFTGGTSPSIVLDPLVRDDGAANGARWKRATQLATFTIDGTKFLEVRVDGRLTFPRIGTVSGAPTGIVLLAYPGLRLGR